MFSNITPNLSKGKGWGFNFDHHSDDFLTAPGLSLIIESGLLSGMNKSILDVFEDTPYFTLQAIQQLSTEDDLVPGSVQTALYRWMRNGVVIQLRKGIYMTKAAYESHCREPDFEAAVSAIIVPKSYLSMESVLKPEGISSGNQKKITCITNGNTRTIKNKIGTFSYRHVKPELFNHYEIREYHGILISVASLPKALFDFFYFYRFSAHSLAGIAKEIEKINAVDLHGFSLSDRELFTMFVDGSGSRKMRLINSALRRGVWQT